MNLKGQRNHHFHQKYRNAILLYHKLKPINKLQVHPQINQLTNLMNPYPKILTRNYSEGVAEIRSLKIAFPVPIQGDQRNIYTEDLKEPLK